MTEPLRKPPVIDAPSGRKPVGMFAIMAIIASWAIIVASASPWIATLPGLVQGVLYCIAGIVWIVPLGPVLRWMEGGRP